MDWRAVLGLDLSGRLRTLTARYRRDVRLFDYTNVTLSTTEWYEGRVIVTAAALGSDPDMMSGINPVTFFWESPKLPPVIEAQAYLDAHLRRASKRHPETRFFRYRNADSGETVREQWQAGVWRQVDPEPLYRCLGCGQAVAGDFCLHCGEPVLW